MTIFLSRYIYHSLILMMLIAFLTACSSTRFVYTFLDKFIEDEITFFLDLDEEDNNIMKKQVSEMVDWHRSTMLPSYATYLSDIADKLEAKQYEVTYITKILDNGRSLIEETVTGLTPYASKFLVKYQTVKAIEFMEKKMLIRRQERLDEQSKPKNILLNNRQEKLISNFERFFGDLTDEQIILVKTHARATLNHSKIRLQNRTMRQKAFVNFLRTQPTEPALTSYLNKLLLSGHQITNPTYKDFSESSLNQFRDLLVNMLATSTTIQRKTIIINLRKYADDFIAVSK